MNLGASGNEKLKRVVSLGFQPLANNLIKSKKDKVEKFPLELNYCENCHNTQLSVAVDARFVLPPAAILVLDVDHAPAVEGSPRVLL